MPQGWTDGFMPNGSSPNCLADFRIELQTTFGPGSIPGNSNPCVGGRIGLLLNCLFPPTWGSSTTSASGRKHTGAILSLSSPLRSRNP